MGPAVPKGFIRICVAIAPCVICSPKQYFCTKIQWILQHCNVSCSMREPPQCPRGKLLRGMGIFCLGGSSGLGDKKTAQPSRVLLRLERGFSGLL